MIDLLKNIDNQILFAINGSHSNLLDSIMWIISEKYFGAPLYILLLYLSFKKFGAKGMLVFLALGLVTVALSDLTSKHFFKEIFERYRPSHNLNIKDKLHYVNDYYGGTYGFVSSHSANMFAITTFGLLTLTKNNKKYWLWLLLLFPMTVALSRVYLGVHYPSDVLVGALWGCFIGWIISRIFNETSIKTLDLQPTKS
ncbi:MAG: phosphatase PAP2 family protein [Flavobacteriales bacterium]|nr:phosphatase PAP2 family protein [Flavobacteriales bacterium]